jgi:hypothetical protein
VRRAARCAQAFLLPNIPLRACSNRKHQVGLECNKETIPYGDPGAAPTALRGHHANDVRLGEGSHCCRSRVGLQRCTGDAAVACWSRHLHGVSSDVPRRNCACERSCDISSKPTLRAALQAASYTEEFYQYRFQRKRGRCRFELPLPCVWRPRTTQAKHPYPGRGHREQKRYSLNCAGYATETCSGVGTPQVAVPALRSTPPRELRGTQHHRAPEMPS